MADKESGVFLSDPNAGAFAHRDAHFDIHSRFNVPRSPQGRPVIFQAGDSDEGRYFAAAAADAIFSRHSTLAAGQGFYADLKGRLARYGRRGDELLILPAATFMIGDTDAEAADIAHEVRLAQVSPQTAIKFLEQLWNRDLADHDPDWPGGLDPFVDQVVPPLEERDAFRADYGHHRGIWLVLCRFIQSANGINPVLVATSVLSDTDEYVVATVSYRGRPAPVPVWDEVAALALTEGLVSGFVRRILVVTAVVAVATMLAGCESKSTGSEKRPASHAVVIVSGGDATSPFTSADQACTTGLVAGNTDTAIREYLLKQGYTVYTSPAMAGRGQVVDQTGFGPFGVCPVTLPENMTVNSTGSIDTAGEHLARFLDYLHTEKGVTDVDFVTHSMGGLYSRAAIRVLATTNSPVHIRSLTTIGTPWQGSYLSDYANGKVPLTDCLGDTFCENAMNGMKDEVLRLMAGSGREVNQAFLMGKDGWNEFQSGVLDKIPVVLIGGKKFTKPGQVNPAVWPNDGLVALQSALAKDISDPVLPHRRCYTFDDTHSIYVSNAAGLDWNTALTWDPQVLDVLHKAIEDAPKALGGANREGCPAN